MRCDVWIIAAAIAACWAIGSMATAQQSNTPAFGTRFGTHHHTHALRPFVGWGEDHVFGRKLMLESCRRSSDVNFHFWLWAASSTNVRCRALRAARTISVSSKSLMLRRIGTWKLMGARST